MSFQETGIAAVVCAAYEAAWQEFLKLPGLTPDEKSRGPNQLRWYIRLMTAVGERDPSKIARSALGMMRQYDQISRSKARIGLHISPAQR